MVRISWNRSDNPASVVGKVESGSGRLSQLQYNEVTGLSGISKDSHNIVPTIAILSHSIDEEVMLIHINLNAGGATIEVKEGLRTMLSANVNTITSRIVRPYTYVHHLGVTTSISSVKQM